MNTRRTLKKTENTEKNENQGFRKTCLGGGSPHVPLNPWFFSFFRASLKRCPYAIIVPGCSDKTRGIIKVNARRKLKNTEKTEKKTEKN